MQRLSSAKHRGEGLKRHPSDVVVRLLCGEGNTRSLSVEAHQPRALVLRTETVLHQAVPDFPRRTILCDLFEEIVVRVEEKRQPRAEFIHVEATAAGPLH